MKHFIVERPDIRQRIKPALWSQHLPTDEGSVFQSREHLRLAREQVMPLRFGQCNEIMDQQIHSTTVHPLAGIKNLSIRPSPAADGDFNACVKTHRFAMHEGAPIAWLRISRSQARDPLSILLAPVIEQAGGEAVDAAEVVIE